MPEMSFVLVGADTLAGESALRLFEKMLPAALPQADHQPVLLGGDPNDDVTVVFSGEELVVQKLANYSFVAGQVVICVGDAGLAESAFSMAQSAGAMVIDATPFSRCQDHARLVHPAVNLEELVSLQQNNVVSVPSDVAMALVPLLQAFRQLGGMARIDMNCSVPVSSFGFEGVAELAGQTNRMLNGLPAENVKFADQIAFNLLPLADTQQGDAATLVREIIALTGLEELPIYASCMIVPVFYGQIVQLSVTLEWEVELRDAIDVLEGVPGLKVVFDDAEECVTPVTLVGADDEERQLVHIWGLTVRNNVLRMWVVFDNAYSGSVNGAFKLYQQLIAEFQQ